MLPRTAEYAVRAAVALARCYGRRAMSADEIATVLGAPRNYLSKTLNALTREGLLTSTRGPGGGFELAVPPERISVADITDIFAGPRAAPARCLLNDALCDVTLPCSAHERWTDVKRLARQPLQQTTIAQLCGMQDAKLVASQS
jgi:Rrf2 family protein